MKLRVRFFGGVYSLVECESNDKTPFGIVFVCEEPPKSELPYTPKEILDKLNSALFCETTFYCRDGWGPDAVQAAHGMCEEDEDIEVLEFARKWVRENVK